MKSKAIINLSLRPLIFNVQEEVYVLRKQDLELKVNDTLLTQEAQKKGVTTRALLDTEVSAKVPRVTDEQAQTFYNENKERISGDFAQVKAQGRAVHSGDEGARSDCCIRRAVAACVDDPDQSYRA